MGVKRGRQLLVKAKVPSLKQNWEEFWITNQTPTISIDLLGAFFPLLLELESRPEMVTALMLKWFEGKKNVLLVLDGKRTREKFATSLARQEKREKEVAKLEALLEKAEDRVLEGKRISAGFYKRMDVLQTRTGSFATQLETLSRNLNGKVRIDHVAFEADVSIASSKADIVISGDSDLIFHGSNATVAIPSRSGNSFDLNVTQIINSRYTNGMISLKL